jgi:hypothetical protein
MVLALGLGTGIAAPGLSVARAGAAFDSLGNERAVDLLVRSPGMLGQLIVPLVGRPSVSRDGS